MRPVALSTSTRPAERAAADWRRPLELRLDARLALAERNLSTSRRPDEVDATSASGSGSASASGSTSASTSASASGSTSGSASTSASGSTSGSASGTGLVSVAVAFDCADEDDRHGYCPARKGGYMIAQPRPCLMD